jgi:hypothetical protein
MESPGGYRKLQSELYIDNMKKNGVEWTGNKRGEEMRNAYIEVDVARERKREKL